MFFKEFIPCQLNIFHYLLAQSGWLYTKIYQNDFFFLDLWSIVHVWTGFMLLMLLRLFKIRRVFTTMFLILLMIEILEILTGYLAPDIFHPEIFKTRFIDLFLGMIGGLLSELFLRIASGSIAKHEKGILSILAFLAAFTYSFVWVGFYRYNYNVRLFNFPGINLAALVFWTSGAYTTIMFYQFLERKTIVIRWLVTWSAYLLVLFTVEFTGYFIFRLHENSVPGAKALAFGLIHGTNVLHFFYLTSPLYTISLFIFFRWLIYSNIYDFRLLSYNNFSN
jgi:hypothetical protein